MDDLLEFLLMMEAYRLEEARSYIEDDENEDADADQDEDAGDGDDDSCKSPQTIE